MHNTFSITFGILCVMRACVPLPYGVLFKVYSQLSNINYVSWIHKMIMVYIVYMLENSQVRRKLLCMRDLHCLLAV